MLDETVYPGQQATRVSAGAGRRDLVSNFPLPAVSCRLVATDFRMTTAKG
jgi:hypothetical protein